MASVRAREPPNSRPLPVSDAGVLVADALVLAEQVADLTAADVDVAGGNVGELADVAAQLGHEGLAEAHDLSVGLALRVEVGAALAAAHRQAWSGSS